MGLSRLGAVVSSPESKEEPRGEVPPGTAPSTNQPGTPPTEEETGWGSVGPFLWFILIIAIIWLMAAWGWGRW